LKTVRSALPGLLRVGELHPSIDGLINGDLITQRTNADIIPVEMEITPEIQAEFEMAQVARSSGNEGRARVCARRAAGIGARRFLNQHGVHLSSGSVYQALSMLAAFPGLAPDLKLAARQMTVQVTTEFSLPEKIDLISEARKLIGGLK
jgi:hypothetical protein